MSDLDKKVAQAMGLKSVNNCEQWGTSMTKDEALKLALEALENGMKFVWTDPEREAGFVAIDAIKEALAQPDAFEQGRQEGMKQEREACAKVCEPSEEHRREASWGYLGGEEGVNLLDAKAADIRARGNT